MGFMQCYGLCFVLTLHIKGGIESLRDYTGCYFHYYKERQAIEEQKPI